ncbi:hypothetical protein GII30_15800 [Gordonia amarae]|uniref:Uncharacterized protein n=2 Tax=Gordonia amarae TaxID=36821 RepID=G7GK88_9ACTN|nr:hypothetical protein [Gordonia amarae]MCS3879871.1 hypothetical protein [Gordonia amarae]QHN18283.1 hypothetical protein GII35_16110 [Gordonia amarae]QHN22767.1 hypothetical protein GII34_15655 [Gordonia amarae]QHN31671.1 hypothetical protein GII32_15965 [Gordonia amarae]QHN40415.1 hypothetical protein GII30_15800 [Gordonia amarae]
MAAPATAAQPCDTQWQYAMDIQRQIKSHNAQPRTFTLPTQQAQFDAYNARAARLNSEMKTARDNYNNCRDAIKSLKDGQELPDPEATMIAKIKDAAAKIPAGYTPPALSKPTRSTTVVAVATELQPLYDALGDSPITDTDAMRLQSAAKPSEGERDPAYPSKSGRTIVKGTDGKAAVTVDRVVPLSRLLSIEGFTKLSPESMYYVSRAPLNLQWLSRNAALSKTSGSVAAVTGTDETWFDKQIDLQNTVEQRLKTLIAQLIASEKK